VETFDEGSVGVGTTSCGVAPLSSRFRRPSREILGATALFLLFELLLQDFDLRPLRLHFGFQFADLIEQVEIAGAHGRELLFERSQAIGSADALCPGRSSECQDKQEAGGERQTSFNHDIQNLEVGAWRSKSLGLRTGADRVCGASRTMPRVSTVLLLSHHFAV
jgi:hypothetical protein